jgi:hypothetical protein
MQDNLILSHLSPFHSLAMYIHLAFAISASMRGHVCPTSVTQGRDYGNILAYLL